MKKINQKQQKKFLIEMLLFIDNISKKNNINYSLIGGSLIGAVRHKGIIPWDDDIDIALMPQEYNKLINILKNKNNEKYILLEPNSVKDYPYPFPKLCMRNSIVIEKRQKKINNYGIFIDIFKYDYVSNNKLIRKYQYFKLVLIKKLLTATILNNKEIYNEKNILKKVRNFIALMIGNNKLKNKYINMFKNKKETNYILLNWPAYGFSKDILKSKNMTLFKRVKFENINAMITCDYDEILKTTFDNYMELPPIEARKTNHNMIAYWRDDNEKNKK